MVCAANRESFNPLAARKTASIPATTPIDPKSGAATMNVIFVRSRQNANAPTTPTARPAAGHASTGEKKN